MPLKIPSCYRLLIGLAFFLSAVACHPASAGDQPVNPEPSTTVKFGDLDLNTDAGRRELLYRLSKAARRVCAQAAISHSDIGGYPEVYGSCYSRTLAAAVDSLHHKELSALFATKSPENTR